MESSSGHLKLNDTDINVREAQCTIFVGRLDIDVTSTFGDVSFLNIPFPSATDLSDLSGQTFSRDDCTKHNYENSIFQPVVSFRTDYFAVRFIKFEALNCENGNLLCAVDLRAVEPESEAELKIRGKIRAEFYPMDADQLLYRQEPIPIRFAAHYLPLLGLPKIPTGSTTTDVIELLGQPHHRGGGPQQLGEIPKWIRYTLSTCYLRFQMENDTITQVTIMPLGNPPCDLMRPDGRHLKD